jgi:hypothetical protein
MLLHALSMLSQGGEREGDNSREIKQLCVAQTGRTSVWQAVSTVHPDQLVRPLRKAPQVGDTIWIVVDGSSFECVRKGAVGQEYMLRRHGTTDGETMIAQSVGEEVIFVHKAHVWCVSARTARAAVCVRGM